MHDNPRTGGEESLAGTTTHEDARDQRSVLFRVLALYPALLTSGDLVREIGAGTERFGETDDIERAIRDLVGAGLLNRIGEGIAPSGAALVFNALDRD